ncbi:MAG TPA: MFS transporter [Rhodocyclaceae bacterium]|nr:MFS transporter [Rhodocyclaceae bacterium]HMV52550.1 MFS transporter [Rhodocyclaceae bacterium]HMZ82896.1 MFS transporter [Rhodocyclaceae bacterium]HNA03443.1 MFS transporter [Rhodocyclaceae bacterium]HNB79143.1 MFS transporter [Rhodocyclaceae bacterium]
MTSFWKTPAAALACGSLILTLAMGVRHGFGLFLPPMSMELGWGRETFAFALALQNLVWGFTQPVIGMLADRWGGGRVVVAGVVLYCAGLYGMASSTSPLMLALTSGVAIGTALSCCTFSVVSGVVGRRYSPAQRTQALGIAGAAGSFGQFAMLPIAEYLISGLGWHNALLALGAAILFMLPAAFGIVERSEGHAAALGATSAREALAEALRSRDYWLLSLGFFVCGFQVVFIAIHLPAFVLDAGLSPKVGVQALALIGLFNIFGSYLAGRLGAVFRKPYLLGGIYIARSLVIVAYLVVPMTAASTYVFSAAMGFLWLGTVPLTNAVVASMFGVRHLAMLAGTVFLFHQVGAFLGSWLGGFLFDSTGSYALIWWISIALGVIALFANLPIREHPPAPVAARA